MESINSKFKTSIYTPLVFVDSYQAEDGEQVIMAIRIKKMELWYVLICQNQIPLKHHQTILHIVNTSSTARWINHAHKSIQTYDHAQDLMSFYGDALYFVNKDKIEALLNKPFVLIKDNTQNWEPTIIPGGMYRKVITVNPLQDDRLFTPPADFTKSEALEIKARIQSVKNKLMDTVSKYGSGVLMTTDFQMFKDWVADNCDADYLEFYL